MIFTTNVNFSSPLFFGVLTSSVLTGDTSNSLGGLTFTYEITLSALSPMFLIPATRVINSVL
jgi:hypothetical protein